MTRLRFISQAVKGYDKELYAGLSSDGVPCIFRRTVSVERYDLDDCVIFKVVNQPHFVFALTNDWKISGYPVDWGVEPILARLGEIDLHKRDLAAEFEKQYDRDKESKDRARRNDAEAFFSDHRREIAKSFDGVNTALIKSDLHKRRD